MPAQIEIGEMWHQGQISVEAEHSATQITLEEMGRLRELRKPVPKHGKKALICTLEGDAHVVGAQVVADFLLFDGWEILFLGSEVSTQRLLKELKKNQSDLLGISLTNLDTLNTSAETIRFVKQEHPLLKILAGGPALSNQSQALEQLRADGYAKSADEARNIARQLVGLSVHSPTLSQYLLALGKKIKIRRKGLRLSQSALAQSAGLDRAYISSVEHGKQNITLAAVLRLAEALNLPLQELLVDSPENPL